MMDRFRFSGHSSRPTFCNSQSWQAYRHECIVAFHSGSSWWPKNETAMTRHSVVIIGGSLAGAACVRELERLGIDAVALERDCFPRAKVCGGFLSPGAVDCVERLGLLDEVRKAGAVDVRSARVRVGSVEVEIPFERPGLGISRS